ncbi:hypothetical protein SAMN05880580_12613 [Priestia flexa]|jgi:hypothetical protein|nr:hypothetical protein GA0061087_102542 [Priestia flexa]SIR49590.1 hypothetical protein SAMN05880580_12613 [Priestia flexa]
MKKLLVGLTLAFTLVAGVASVGAVTQESQVTTLGLPNQH